MLSHARRTVAVAAAAVVVVVLMIPLVLGSAATGRAAALADDEADARAAMREVLAALAAKDQARLVGVMHVASPDQRPLAEAMAELLVAGRTLADAATARFGAAGAGIAEGPIAARDAADVDQAHVEPAPDNSGLVDLYMPGHTLPVKFARAPGGGCKLSIDHYHGGQSDQIARQAALLRMTAVAMNEAAVEIGQDRYADAPSAEAAIKQKLNFVLMRSLSPKPAGPAGPATTPANAAATQPSR